MEKLVNDEIRAFVLDIEGTTTSIRFVKDILFPYAQSHIESYLKEHWGQQKLTDDVDLLLKQYRVDKETKEPGLPVNCDISGETLPSQKFLLEYVLWQMDKDKKTTALKQLQGHIWQSGYNEGELKGHLYDDVLPALKQWHISGKKIFIYSSGSIEAQKLLFGSTEHGDITQFLSGYFDTKIGSKSDKASYKKIASEIGEEPNNIIFLTDIHKEALAAKLAGLKSIIVIREGNAPIKDEDKMDFLQIHSFEELNNLKIS